MKNKETRRALWSVAAMLAIMLSVGLFVGSAFASLPVKIAQGKSPGAPNGFTETPTGTITVTVTITATGTATEVMTSTATGTATQVMTSTATGTATQVMTSTATGTATATITATSTLTSTATSTRTATAVATNTTTATTTATRTSTSVASTTATRTVTGTATAMATASRTPGNGRVAICHRTGSQRNPWVQIEVSENALPAHQAHGDIYPVPANGCPGPGTPAPTTSMTPVVSPTAETCDADSDFNDVPRGHTFHPFVKCLACKHILGGYSDGSYRYGNPVTRGQIAKIVANSAGYLEEVSGQRFSDVPPGSTFYEFIERMAARGHIGGYPNGTYRPNDPATRGQIAKIVSNAAGHRDPVSGQTYTDVPPQETFYLFVERLSKRGIVGGYQDGTFRTNALTTRGQAAKMVANAFFPICPEGDNYN